MVATDKILSVTSSSFISQYNGETTLEREGYETLYPATDDQIYQVLASLGGMYIRGEFITGPDIGAIDNVYFGISS